MTVAVLVVIVVMRNPHVQLILSIDFFTPMVGGKSLVLIDKCVQFIKGCKPIFVSAVLLPFTVASLRYG